MIYTIQTNHKKQINNAKTGLDFKTKTFFNIESDQTILIFFLLNVQSLSKFVWFLLRYKYNLLFLF